MALAHKKVVLRSLANTLTWGYLPPVGFLLQNQIQLMTLDGHLSSLPANTIKRIAYVKDFNLDDPSDPERIGRMAFPSRPRGDGLWLCLTFLDNQILEGLSTFDLAFIDSILNEQGLFLTPPDPRSNTQRLFIPRSALARVEVLGFVTAPSRRPSPPSNSSRRHPLPAAQSNLFDP
ncbi:MAG: DUF6982 domain-containing protein [Acidobacteriaceae bacterium]